MSLKKMVPLSTFARFQRRNHPLASWFLFFLDSTSKGPSRSNLGAILLLRDFHKSKIWGFWSSLVPHSQKDRRHIWVQLAIMILTIIIIIIIIIIIVFQTWLHHLSNDSISFQDHTSFLSSINFQHVSSSQCLSIPTTNLTSCTAIITAGTWEPQSCGWGVTLEVLCFISNLTMGLSIFFRKGMVESQPTKCFVFGVKKWFS